MTAPSTVPQVERARLVAAHEDAAEFYRRMLLGPEGEGPRRYLTDRGFAALLDQTPWTVGYAPPEWTRLRDHLTTLGYRDETLHAAGLIRTGRRGSPVDCFRDRITFGIRDTEHALVGFTARCAPDAPGHVPRYLNTRATTVYDKSQLLFGAGEATPAERRTVVLTEGPLDAIAVDLSHRTATTPPAALALGGTAITEHHRNSIAALGAEQVILAFDDDRAGARARENAYRMLHGTADINAIEPLDDADVAETLQRKGRAAVNTLLQQSGPAIDAIIEDRLASWPNRTDNAEAAIACLRSLAQLLSELKPDDMARQATRLHDAISLPTADITRELAEAATTQRPCRTPNRDGTRAPVASL